MPENPRSWASLLDENIQHGSMELLTDWTLAADKVIVY